MAKPNHLKKCQKADLRGGAYFQVPKAVFESVAFNGLDPYAQALLMRFVSRFTGFNNGEIGYSAREMIDDLGGCHYDKVKAALADLIAAGFIARGERFAKIDRKADEWRITFISTGSPSKTLPATNDYKDGHVRQ